MEVVKHETCLEYFRRRLSEGWKCISLEGYKVVLLSPCGFRRELDLRNDVETLRPNAAGDYTNWDSQEPGSGSNYDKVDEAEADDDTTYVYDNKTAETKDSYNLESTALLAGSTIISVTIYFRIWAFYGHCRYTPHLRLGTNETTGTPLTPSASGAWETHNEVLSRPGGGSWVISDLNGLQACIGGYTNNTTYDFKCTQVYVEVDYTPPYQVVSPSSISSSESFGTPAIVPGAVTISPSAIASHESFGDPTILPGVVIISPSSIPSAEAFGTPIVTTGLTIFPSSIPSAESFGTPSLVYNQIISPSSIPSAESFGTPAILPGVVIISPSAIASLEAFGTPAILPGVVIISPSAIASLESFGIPALVYNQTISPSAIASLEAFGVPIISLLTRYDLWTYWNVDAYAVAVCSFDSAVFAFRIDATDGHLYRCESADNAESWGSWIDMGDVSGVSNTRLACCFKDSDESIVLYSIGGTLYRRRWNGSTWEAAAAWSNSLSSITGIAVTYMGDWNVVVTGVDGDGRAGVWTCVLGNGYSAAVDTWSALKEVVIAEAGAGITFSFPSLSMPDVFRMFFVETYSGSESYSRPYWSHSLATADFISNLWREPIPFNLDSDHGLSLCYKSPYVWLSMPARVWRASLTPPFVELTDSLLSVSSEIIPYRGGIDISLRNDDRRFNSLGIGTYEAIKKASEILISWGYHTSEGKETGGFDPTTWIESWEYVTRGGASEFILHSFDGWDLLERWRARRQFTWSAGSKNIYQLLALIFARAGLELSAFSTSTALVNQYPAFTINPGDSGLTAVKRLLSMVPDVIFFVRDTAYLKNPLAADSSQYAYGGEPAESNHVILEASYLDRSATFNRAQVFGDGVFTEDWAWDEIALVHDRLAQASDINIDSTTKAHQRGESIIRDSDIEGIDGHILVPMNCGQDLFDMVAITSPQVGLDASKRRVISLTRTWTPNKPNSRYQMRVGLGAP